MQIKKLTDELVYIKKTTQHLFDVDGKKIKVYEKNEDAKDITEYEQEIDIADIELLSDEEVAALKLNLTEALALPSGDSIDVDVVTNESSEEADIPLDPEEDEIPVSREDLM